MDSSPSLRPDKVVDARGIPCPGPLLRLIDEFKNLAAGDIISVYSTDEGVKVDCRAWARKSGNEFLGDFEREGYYEVAVKKIAGEM
ncbi:hypothetical protein IX51_07380 [uncultured archaeon]|nr:hypothetical protein IX51_07380 [uncultured archaeon]HKJ96415.1 sulfurtransferase TusA family protein [Thermoplasmataceae archaeon]